MNPAVLAIDTDKKDSSPGSFKVTLPFFTGIETANLRADHYLRMVEQCGMVNGWGEDAKLNAAMLNLRDTAQAWSIIYSDKITKEGKRLTWVNFKDAFLKRFHRRTTVADKQALLSRLRQRTGESVDDFMDRIDLTISDVDEFDTKQSIYFFLQGVPTAMKKFLEENKDLITRDDFLNAGRAFEKAHGQANPDALINTLEDKTENPKEMNKELIEALADSLDLMMRRRRPQRTENQKQSKARQGTNNNNNRRRPFRRGQGQGRRLICYRCRRIGHFARDCRVPKNLIAELEEWEGKENKERDTEISYTLEHTLN